jgi:hypothetical protein
VEPTDDYLIRGDVLSFRGRLARDRGDFATARVAFENSIETYSRWNSTHRNVGRSYVNLAITCLDQINAIRKRDTSGRGSVSMLQDAMRHLEVAGLSRAERRTGARS